VVEDYRDLELCKMYGCLPSELDAEDASRVMRHWRIDQAIERYHRLDAEARAKRK